jgi:hypothetical protein
MMQRVERTRAGISDYLRALDRCNMRIALVMCV